MWGHAKFLDPTCGVYRLCSRTVLLSSAMNHLAVIRQHLPLSSDPRGLHVKAAGRFYTHELIGKQLASAWMRAAGKSLARAQTVTIADPFCGDGRLVAWSIESAFQLTRIKDWTVHLWDVDPNAVEVAQKKIRELAAQLKVGIDVHAFVADSFQLAADYEGKFDFVVTNPPWELLKPDSRELKLLPEFARNEYVAALRKFDEYLARQYPKSQPKRKFAGWGTNLARAGTELACRIARDGAYVAVVSPASLFADDTSGHLRRWLFVENTLVEATYFPAELQLFPAADVTCGTLLLRREATTECRHKVTSYSSTSQTPTVCTVAYSKEEFASRDFTIPISFGLDTIDIVQRFASLPSFGDLESSEIWAGREVDETNITQWFVKQGGARFLRGRNIDRYKAAKPADCIAKTRHEKLSSVKYERIAWRDVSRPNQKRRMIATLVPRRWVTGNSLSVAHFLSDESSRLRALLGLMNSLPFELQLRARLATGHVSLSAVRTVRIPWSQNSPALKLISKYVEAALEGDEAATPMVEAASAHAYKLSFDDLQRVVAEFPKLEAAERVAILNAYKILERKLNVVPLENQPPVKIPNHYSAKLSALDLETARAIPPGGNWKDVPVSIPLKRLQTIRESFARGEGSRSTYYGRLRPDRPAYTINTYFSRPGNGCHLHYDYSGDQHRVISQREASRFQTFPDSFKFCGSKTSINQQIGNAVPPLLAFRIAKQLPGPGLFVDLFSGAGGMGLGFTWAGWQSVVANDIEPYFLQTYVANLHPHAVEGDIRDGEVVEKIVKLAKAGRKANPSLPLWVLGGPPCQGFSTAGKKRTLDDERNHLFKNYIRILELLQPDGFVFENVTGLLNMEGGRVFEQISNALKASAKGFGHWVLAAEEHGIPQRRTRVIILGFNRQNKMPAEPAKLTGSPDKDDLFSGRVPWVSAHEALSDLPSLQNGQDGSHLEYASAPASAFQRLMRGLIEPEKYFELLQKGQR